MQTKFMRALQADDAYDECAATDLIVQINGSLAPCRPDHPFLVAHRIPNADAQIYTGVQEIEGVQCHGCIALPLFNAEGEQITFAFLAKTSDREFSAVLPTESEWTGCFARIGIPADILLVSIDWAAGMSAHLASGHAVAVAIREENLRTVCKSLAAKYPSKKIIICDDLRTMATLNVAEENGFALAMPYREGGHASFNALLRSESGEAVKRAIDAILTPGGISWDSAMLQREVLRLSDLTDIEYEQQRMKSAKKFDVRAQFIDKKVEEVRELRTASLLSSEDVIEPYEKAVDGQELLQDLIRTIRRFTVLTPSACMAVGLWTIFSYLIPQVTIAPILGLVSPVKRCGKTTLLTLLQQLCFRPLATSNITPAALYRCIEQSRPTLLIDEADTFIHGSSELNGIVNSGHTLTSAYVFRVVESKAERFSTFCAKAIAVIGALPETMQDRTIAIPLRRKRASEKVDSIRNISGDEFRLLKSKILRWTSDNAAQISMRKPALNGISNDRAIDNWEPLIAIANQLGEKCLEAALTAASELSSNHENNRS